MWKRKLWTCGITLAIVAAAVATLTILLKHEPTFYRQNQLPPSETRKELAYTFVRAFVQMFAIMDAREKDEWGCDTTDAQMNCFFDEVFVQFGEAEDLRKLGISDPSVVLEENNRMRLAFRYGGTGWFSTVLSYEIKIWLVPKEPNVIGIEIESARAGALPISKRSILNQLAEVARKKNWKVTPYRHESNAVLLIDLKGDQQQPTWMLTTLTVSTNTLTVRGKTLEHELKLPVHPNLTLKGQPLP